MNLIWIISCTHWNLSISLCLTSAISLTWVEINLIRYFHASIDKGEKNPNSQSLSALPWHFFWFVNTHSQCFYRFAFFEAICEWEKWRKDKQSACWKTRNGRHHIGDVLFGCLKGLMRFKFASKQHFGPMDFLARAGNARAQASKICTSSQLESSQRTALKCQNVAEKYLKN